MATKQTLRGIQKQRQLHIQCNYTTNGQMEANKKCSELYYYLLGKQPGATNKGFYYLFGQIKLFVLSFY